MFFIVDLIIVAILLICVGLGYKRGLTGSLIKILSFVIALVIAFVLFKPISNIIINNTQADEKIQQSIATVFEENEEANKNQESNSTSAETNKETTVAAPIMEYMNEQVEKSTKQVKQDAVNTVSENVAVLIINVGVIIVLFIIARIALCFVKVLTNLLTKLPVIKQFDHLGGIIFGLIQGCFIIFLILAIISFIAPATGNYAITKAIGASYIGSELYNNNILLNIIF